MMPTKAGPVKRAGVIPKQRRKVPKATLAEFAAYLGWTPKFCQHLAKSRSLDWFKSAVVGRLVASGRLAPLDRTYCGVADIIHGDDDEWDIVKDESTYKKFRAELDSAGVPGYVLDELQLERIYWTLRGKAKSPMKKLISLPKKANPEVEKTQKTFEERRKAVESAQRELATAEYARDLAFTQHIHHLFDAGLYSLRRNQKVRYYVYDEEGFIKGRKWGKVMQLAPDTLFRNRQPIFLVSPITGSKPKYLTRSQIDPDFSYLSPRKFKRWMAESIDQAKERLYKRRAKIPVSEAANRILKRQAEKLKQREQKRTKKQSKKKRGK